MRCIDCDSSVSIKGCKKGEIVTCSDCGLEYEIVVRNGRLVAIELELDGEDWGE